ncbi:MAG: fibrinogen-like YCDxxxxGGGW domain-containing protein [Myxococcota bacterium]
MVRLRQLAVILAALPGCGKLSQAQGGLDTLGAADTSGSGGATDEDSGGESGPSVDGDDDGTSDPGGCGGDEDCPAGDQCVGGLCIGDTCVEGQMCDPEAVCSTGAIDCSGEEVQCRRIGPGPPGVVCGDAMVCDVAGDCVECKDGQECQAPGECVVGTILCGGGEPVCMASGMAPAGTGCADGRFCDAKGACLPATDCAEIQMFNPLLPSGVYEIDPDGPDGEMSFDVFCEMDVAGGAWSLWHDEAMNDLEANAMMPRCGMDPADDCFAGVFAGRGDAPGIFRRTGEVIEELAPDFSWAPVEVVQEHHTACSDTQPVCDAGEGNCLFSFIGDGADCCTETSMNNLCVVAE